MSNARLDVTADSLGLAVRNTSSTILENKSTSPYVSDVAVWGLNDLSQINVWRYIVKIPQLRSSLRSLLQINTYM